MTEEYEDDIPEVETKSIPKRLILEEGKLIAYQCMDHAPLIQKASADREWMEKTHQKFPYRCLPMVIGNQIGWDVINPVTFKAVWNGGPAPSDVTLIWPTPKRSNLPSAHFGAATLTFTLGHLFQTPHGVNLMAMGPPNEPKDGIQPLMGVVETDWLPATFTMNWIFTRPRAEVVFEAGESFCRLIPIPRYITEYLDPQIKMLDENPELKAKHEAWKASRDAFNKGLKDPASPFIRQKWQKDYFKGGGSLWPKFMDHQTRLQQKEFEDMRPATVRSGDQVPGEDVRNLSINIPGRPPLNLFIPSLEHGNDAKQARANHIATLKSGHARGSTPSGQTAVTSHIRVTEIGAHEQRGTKEPDLRTPVQPDRDSFPATQEVPERGNSTPPSDSESGSSSGNIENTDTPSVNDGPGQTDVNPE